MAVKLLEEGGAANGPNKVFVADSTSEMEAIEEPQFGTLVLNLEDGFFYCSNSSGEWKKINNY